MSEQSVLIQQEIASVETFIYITRFSKMQKVLSKEEKT